MSVEVMTKVFYTTFPNLSFENQKGDKTQVSGVTAKIVMLAMADSSNEVGDNTFNGVERLAMKTNLTVRSVTRATKALVMAGYLSEHEERSNYGTKSYMINLDMLGEKPDALKKKMGRPKNSKNKVLDSAVLVLDSAEKVMDVASSDSELNVNKHHIQESQQKKLQTTQPTEPPAQASELAEQSTPAKKETNEMTTADEYKKRVEEKLFASLTNAIVGYAHYPEDVRPVMERLERLWYLRPPRKPKKGGGQYAMWIEAGRELLDACGEFGAEMLDDLREDWDQYNRENKGLAPHIVSSPRSLVNSAAGKAALLRQGIKTSQWARKGGQAAHQSRLDV